VLSPFTEGAAMIEYHRSILSTDGKVISRHNLFCKEVGSGVVEATGTHDVELWQGEQKIAVIPRIASR